MGEQNLTKSRDRAVATTSLPVSVSVTGDRNIAKSRDRAMTMSTVCTIRYVSMSTKSKARVA